MRSLIPNLAWSQSRSHDVSHTPHEISSQISSDLIPNLVRSQSKSPMIHSDFTNLCLNLMRTHQKFVKSHPNLKRSKSKSYEISQTPHGISPQISWEHSPILMRSHPNLTRTQSKSLENSGQIMWDLMYVWWDIYPNLMRALSKSL